MVSRDTVDRMVNGADDLSEVRQNLMEQATELAPSSAQEAAGEITPEQDFFMTSYSFQLGERTLTRYYQTFFYSRGGHHFSP